MHTYLRCTLYFCASPKIYNLLITYYLLLITYYLQMWWPVLLEIIFAIAIATAYQYAMIPEKLGLLLVVGGYIAMMVYLTKK